MKNFVFYNKLFEKIFFNRSIKHPLIDHLCLVQIIFAKTNQVSLDAFSYRDYYLKSVRYTIDMFPLNNSLANNGKILRFAYRKIDIQRRTFSNCWDFCSSYYQITAVLILVLEGLNKKVGFLETNSSEYSVSKSKMQDLFLSQALLAISKVK